MLLQPLHLLLQVLTQPSPKSPWGHSKENCRLIFISNSAYAMKKRVEIIIWSVYPLTLHFCKAKRRVHFYANSTHWSSAHRTLLRQCFYRVFLQRMTFYLSYVDDGLMKVYYDLIFDFGVASVQNNDQEVIQLILLACNRSIIWRISLICLADIAHDNA